MNDLAWTRLLWLLKNHRGHDHSSGAPCQQFYLYAPNSTILYLTQVKWCWKHSARWHGTWLFVDSDPSWPGAWLQCWVCSKIWRQQRLCSRFNSFSFIVDQGTPRQQSSTPTPAQSGAATSHSVSCWFFASISTPADIGLLWRYRLRVDWIYYAHRWLVPHKGHAAHWHHDGAVIKILQVLNYVYFYRLNCPFMKAWTIGYNGDFFVGFVFLIPQGRNAQFRQ